MTNVIIITAVFAFFAMMPVIVLSSIRTVYGPVAKSTAQRDEIYRELNTAQWHTTISTGERFLSTGRGYIAPCRYHWPRLYSYYFHNMKGGYNLLVRVNDPLTVEIDKAFAKARPFEEVLLEAWKGEL